MTTQPSDGELRRTYEALLRQSRRPAAAQRVSPERILALVERRGSEAERLATLDAVMSDSESAHEFEMLRSLAIARQSGQPSGWRSARGWLAIAASLLIIAIPAGRLVMHVPDGGATRSALQGAVLVTPAEDASAADSRTFVWHPLPGAQSYRMELLTAAGSPVFTTRTTDTTVTLPRDVAIAANVEHRWWVSTEMSDGTQRASVFRRLFVRDAK